MFKVGDLVFVAGKVLGVKAGTGNAAGVLQTVVLESMIYDKDQQKSVQVTYECNFWNKGEKKRADRIINMKIREGSYVVAEGFLDQQNNTIINGINVGYPKSTFVIEQKDKAPVTIYFGNVGFAEERSNANGAALRASFMTQELGYQNEHWTGITFQDHTFDDGSVTRIFDRASKVIKKGNLVLLRCSEIKPYESNSKTYYSAFGQGFEVIKFKDGTSAPTPSASVQEDAADCEEPDFEEDNGDSPFH